MEKHPESVRAIFDRALEIESPVERQSYLDEACAANPELRQEVESLLEAHEQAGDFLDRPAVEDMAARPPASSDATAALEPAAGGEEVVFLRGSPPESASTDGVPGGDEEEIALDFLQPSTKPGSVGRLGHYEVLEVLGRGGFGIVLKVFDEMLHRVVAVKVMSRQLAATSPARKRFLREARASAAVRHENVVAIYAVEEQPIPYLVMEYIAGQTLQQKLDQTGPLDVPAVLRLGRQIAGGLAAAHAMGLIHRDIKPSNILLENGVEQRIKIADFGLARAADDASLTQSGVVAGTPMYMAPEQARGEAIDHRADLFSLGSVLYVMCSGRPPFRASTTLAVLKRVAEDTPRPIREIIPEVPEWLCAIIAKLHAKKPEERFGSAKEVADVLARCLAAPQGQGVPAPPHLAQAADRPRRDREPRPRWLVPAGAAVLLACLLLVVFLLAYWLRPSHGEPPADPKAPVVFRVEANQPWQDTGVDVVEGEVIVLAPQGTWRKGEQTCPAAGLEQAPRERAIWPELPLLCLLVRIGDEPPTYPVRQREVIKPKHSGRLFVQANDLDLEDNGDGLQLTITGGLHIGDAAPPLDLLPVQAADRDWKPLLARIDSPATKLDDARDEVFDYCLKYAGTPQAFRAGRRLLKAPSLPNGYDMDLRPIPPGKFLMGSPDEEPGRKADESRHEVVITRPFYMGVYDVTVGQFKAFVAETGYQADGESPLRLFPDGGWRLDSQADWRNPGFEQTDDYPVTCVTWQDAKAFCAWLSEKTGKHYALPTEAQWEYACRAESRTKFSFGNNDQELARYAWYVANSDMKPHPVSGLEPNAWGLYDMHGNVWQWTADRYAADYYQTCPREDPPGPGVGGNPVMRGGDWHYDASVCRAANRYAYHPASHRGTNIGFRVVVLP